MSDTSELRRLLTHLEDIEAEEFPAVIRRRKRRKAESAVDWKNRALQLLVADIEKADAEEAKLEGTISQAALDEVARGAGDIDRFRDPLEIAPLVPIRVSPYVQWDAPVDGPVTSSYRGIMAGWVSATMISKEAEANCDLECGCCPTQIMFNCALQNQTAAASDGFSHE